MTARWLECRIVDGWRYSDSHSLGGATRCFGGPGASAANGSEAQGKGARSLRRSEEHTSELQSLPTRRSSDLLAVQRQPFAWGCHAVFWRTGCVGCERI